jgi:hypothetical protein
MTATMMADLGRGQLVDLIVWLSRPYTEVTPVFPDTPHGRRLKDAWQHVFGDLPQAPGEWVQCACCGHWAVKAPSGGSDD